MLGLNDDDVQYVDGTLNDRPTDADGATGNNESLTNDCMAAGKGFLDIPNVDAGDGKIWYGLCGFECIGDPFIE